jgi:hypothetical protein
MKPEPSQAPIHVTMLAAGAFIADRIGARHHPVPGTDHFPHRDRSGPV